MNNVLKNLADHYNNDQSILTKFLYELSNLPVYILRKYGLRPYSFGSDNIYDDKVLMLFPRDWYDFIPNEFEIVDIFYKTEKFKKGLTDKDSRAGYLAYGILTNFYKEDYDFYNKKEGE